MFCGFWRTPPRRAAFAGRLAVLLCVLVGLFAGSATLLGRTSVRRKLGPRALALRGRRPATAPRPRCGASTATRMRCPSCSSSERSVRVLVIPVAFPKPARNYRPVASRVDFEHVLVVGAGQMGGGIAQVVAGSGAACRSTTRSPVLSTTGSRRCATQPREARRRRAGPTPTRCSTASSPVDDLVPADLMVEAVIEDAAVKEDVFRPGGRDAPVRGRPRVEHVVDPDHVARGRDAPAGPRDRHALLQPGAGADARRGRSAAWRPPTRRPPRSPSWPRELGKTPAEANDFPASSRTGS